MFKIMTIKNIRVKQGSQTLNNGLPSGTSEDGGKTIVAVVTWNLENIVRGDPLFLSQKQVEVEGEDEQGKIFKQNMVVSSVGPPKGSAAVRETTFRAV